MGTALLFPPLRYLYNMGAAEGYIHAVAVGFHRAQFLIALGLVIRLALGRTLADVVQVEL